MTQSLPVLTTERLLLKAVTILDPDAYKKHFVDYEVIQYLSTIETRPANFVSPEFTQKELWELTKEN